MESTINILNMLNDMNIERENADLDMRFQDKVVNLFDSKGQIIAYLFESEHGWICGLNIGAMDVEDYDEYEYEIEKGVLSLKYFFCPSKNIDKNRKYHFHIKSSSNVGTLATATAESCIVS